MICRPLALAAAMLLLSPLLADDFFVDGRNGADLPGNGRSRQTPWKTVAYALAQIPAPAQGTAHALRIAGGQTYAATTNGEVFPLGMRPAISLVGEGAPVLEPGSQLSLRFASGSDYRADTRIVDLVLRGAFAVQLGPIGTEHSPSFVGCRFEGGGIAMYPGDYARIFARIEGCTFVARSTLDDGLLVNVAGQCTEARVEPSVVDCVFADAWSGVYVDHGHDSPRRTQVHVRVARSRFLRCTIGLLYWTESHDGTSFVTVTDCSFHGSGRAGVLSEGFFDGLTVEGSRFFAEGQTYESAILIQNGLSGPALLRRNVVVGGTAGVTISAPHPLLTLAGARIEDSVIVGCDRGIEIGGMASPAPIEVTRCRLIGNRLGFWIRSGSSGASGQVALTSTIVAGGSDGLYLSAGSVVTANGLTIADHLDAGIRLVRVGAGSSLVHCVFAGNATDLAVPSDVVLGTLTASYSAFASQHVPGTGNLHVDPRLLRPAYKLLPDSPCIDAGTLRSALPATDYEGDPRIVAGAHSALPDMGADEFVPAGSVRRHGLPGLGGAGIEPRIASPNLGARPGEVLDVQVRDARDASGVPAAAAILLLGTEETATDLTPIGAPGSLLWTAALASLGPVVPDAGGIATLRLQLPDDPAWYGQCLQLQWAVVHPGAGPAGLVTSDALRLTVGTRP